MEKQRLYCFPKTHPRPSRLLLILNSEHTETTSTGEAAEKMNCRFKSLRTEDWRVSDTRYRTSIYEILE